MKKKLILLFSLFLLLTHPVETDAFTLKEQLVRKIDIIKREITVLQGLISNLYARNEPRAEAYLAVDLVSGEVLVSKNPDSPLPMASITKLMTSLIASEETDSSETITLTREMLSPYGTSPVLFSGAKVSSLDLIKASLTQSSNDAAEALSFFRSNPLFISKMNQKAKELGMNNTTYYDAHGLNPANQSSASDLVKLISYIYNNHPELLEITRDNDFWLPDPDGRMLKFANVNGFYYLPSFVGGKTGYLPEALETMVAVFNLEDRAVALVVLRSDNRQADIFSLLRMVNSNSHSSN